MPSVAVLVELVRSPVAGGQIKCWERFAEAAAGLDPAHLGVDLTIYVLGDRERTYPLSPGVRFVTLRPVLSTAPLVRLVGGVDVADFAPYHPALARLLPRHDVWHLTHIFAFSATAVRLRRRGVPAGMVASVHTDVPALTAAYVRSAIDALPPLRWLAARLPERYSAEAGAAGIARRRRDRILGACDHVQVATQRERAELDTVVGVARTSLLGLGIDRERFRPDPAARAELAHAYGIPPEATLVLFAGRVDASKRVLLVAEAVRRLRDSGRDVHLVVVGTGADAAGVSALLGRSVTLLGAVSQERLAHVYPGCDLLAFPSLTETVGSVVAEAMACELPVVLPAGARTTQWLTAAGADGVVVLADDPQGWTAELARLVDDPALRAAIGARAGRTARIRHRTWAQVLAEDLLPVWRRAAGRLRPAEAPFQPVRPGPHARI